MVLTRSVTGLAFVSLLFVATSGCAAGLCERKTKFFSGRCAGSEVVYTPDPSCEAKIEACTAAQKAQMEAYVSCLERANICSLAVVGQCAEQHPGGVNLSCPND
ncbi:MAG: hypothetical protein HC923_13445 [Myxococcales bacterium]|nr:hypothetical protein [Myxococcales bacterium]